MRVIELLQLNDPSYCRRRRFILQIVELAAKADRMLYRELMGFPDDLPDLSRLHVPAGNSRPKGLQRSYNALRQEGKLAATY